MTSTDDARSEGPLGAAAPSLEHLLGDLAARAVPAETDAGAGPVAAALGAGDRAAARGVQLALGDGRYAVAIDRVAEIGEVPRVTPVPNLPAFVCGVANLRGDVLAVLDLAALLGLGEVERSRPGARLVVVRRSAGLAGEIGAGLLVDGVLGALALPAGGTAAVPPGVDARLRRLLAGVFSHGSRLVGLLDLDALFAADEVRALAGE